MNTSGHSSGRLAISRGLFPMTALAIALAFAAAETRAQLLRSDDAKKVEGRVQSMTTAPMGEIDGAILDDGTVIHWPPHLADRFTAIVARGEQVSVSGWMETGPGVDTHLEAQTVTNLRTNARVSGEIGPTPARPPADGSRDFAPQPTTASQVERRLKALEDQVAQLREEIQRLRDEL